MDLLISEVGPRNGLQCLKTIMPTSAKKAWIDTQHQTGCREIEVGFFVPATLLPKLADTPELTSYPTGLDTGIDLNQLNAVRELVQEALPTQKLYGFMPLAGLPKDWPCQPQHSS